MLLYFLLPINLFFSRSNLLPFRVIMAYMLRIYLARHGQDRDNEKGILNGHRDEPLSELGISQAESLAEKIASSGLHFDYIYASPLKRAFKTAEIISRVISGPVPVAENTIIERDFGVMTGQSVAKIEDMCAPDIIKTETVTYFLDPAGAETFPDLFTRGKKALDLICKKHDDGNILLLAHGDIGKMIYAAYYNLPWLDVLTMFHFGNAELLLLSPENGPEEAKIFETVQYNN